VNPATITGPGALILCEMPGRNPEPGTERVHEPACYWAEPHSDRPWPRREVTRAEARAAGWRRCGHCKPIL
jgi:hypothetical protein